MPYTMEEFQKEVAETHLRFLTVADILKQTSKEDILEYFAKKEFLKRLSKEDIVAYLTELNNEDSV
ncbi:MAG: hypothetical protein GQ569_09790 [Methylococcaceae bacterium]|nr:hypothetical protein [Methylococcaceae bacterium]